VQHWNAEILIKHILISAANSIFKLAIHRRKFFLPLSTKDNEWEESLGGIHMLVEDGWWDGCSGSDLNPGLIVAVDFSDEAGRFFILQLDGDDKYTYPMRYVLSSSLFYANEKDRSFHKFHLRDGMIQDAAHEENIIAQLQRNKHRRHKPSNSPADIAARPQSTSNICTCISTHKR
jgi:hypothetical protein